MKFRGKLDAGGKKFAIVAGRFNTFIAERLIEGATDCLLRHGAAEQDSPWFACPVHSRSLRPPAGSSIPGPITGSSVWAP